MHLPDMKVQIARRAGFPAVSTTHPYPSHGGRFTLPAEALGVRV